MKSNRNKQSRRQAASNQRIVLNDNPGPQEAKFGAGVIKGKVELVADGPEMRKLLQAAGVN